MNIRKLDSKLIDFFKRISLPLARFSIFLVFFWFGFLKVVGFSPASELVKELLAKTIPLMDPNTFVLLFGGFEMFIGILFMIRGLERFAIPLLFAHMGMTIMPLLALPGITWAYPLIPTLEGQYIIKNILIIAVAISIAAHLHPLKEEKTGQTSPAA